MCIRDSDDEGRDDVEQALDGVGTQIEGAAAQQEVLDAAPDSNSPMNGVDAFKVSLEGELCLLYTSRCV